MYDDDEEEDKKVKIELPRYRIIYEDIDPKKVTQILECKIKLKTRRFYFY